MINETYTTMIEELKKEREKVILELREVNTKHDQLLKELHFFNEILKGVDNNELE